MAKSLCKICEQLIALTKTGALKQHYDCPNSGSYVVLPKKYRKRTNNFIKKDTESDQALVALAAEAQKLNMY